MDEHKVRVTSSVLVEKDGKLLLAERNKANYNGYWIIPGGGVHFGETTEQAAIREIKEEAGLDVDIKSFIGLKEVINVPGNYHSIVFFYLASPKNDNIAIDKSTKDIAKAKFFSIEEIKQLKEKGNLIDSAEWAIKEAGFWV